MKSDLTIDNIIQNQGKFSENLFSTLKTLIDFSQNKSPLSDIKFIAKKLNTKLDGIKINDQDWIPVRNVLRLAAKIADDDFNGNKVSEINIQGMICGCDYFSGDFNFITSDNIMRGGKYKWKWTEFPGRDKHYNKFIIYSNEVL